MMGDLHFFRALPKFRRVWQYLLKRWQICRQTKWLVYYNRIITLVLHTKYCYRVVTMATALMYVLYASGTETENISEQSMISNTCKYLGRIKLLRCLLTYILKVILDMTRISSISNTLSALCFALMWNMWGVPPAGWTGCQQPVSNTTLPYAWDCHKQNTIRLSARVLEAYGTMPAKMLLHMPPPPPPSLEEIQHWVGYVRCMVRTSYMYTCTVVLPQSMLASHVRTLYVHKTRMYTYSTPHQHTCLLTHTSTQ